MMKKRMCCIKVLVVLDDVDNIHQLEALAGERNWFKPGSRIIITTRDEQPLVAHGINSILYASLLSNREALCLFSRYAFGKEIPIQGYEKLSQKVVRYASGLPLALKVLGSFLCGKNELEWKNAIQKLKTIPSMETFEILQISYNSLEEKEKDIFLDVACIFKGSYKDDAIKALESCGFHARIGLRVLEQKSLITINKYGRLDMHDRIEEMGKYIVRREHEEEPNKHSRLWIEKEIEDVLVSDQGTNEAIRCIKLNSSELHPKIVVKGFGNMKKLRFLQVENGYGDYLSNNWKFDEDLPYFPNALRSLRWIWHAFGSLPKSFQANNLVQLNLEHSKIVQLWEGGDTKVLNKLRFLDMPLRSNKISGSKLRTLDLRAATPNLEILCLYGCHDLVELHIPDKLKSIIIIQGSKLRTLDLRGTANLEELTLYKCVDLVELHIPGERLKLESVEINGSKLRTLDLRGTPNLEKLSLRYCIDLEELHIPGECLKLKSININPSKLRTLDLRGTPNLEYLHLDECVELVEFHIPSKHLKIKSIKIKGSKLMTLDPRFARFYEEHGSSLIGNVEKLISFGLCACTNRERFSQSICCLPCLTKLTLEGSIPEAPKDLDRLGCLEELHLLSTKITRLPDSICLLKHLKCLELNPCWHLQKLPKDLGRLECLEKLILLGCYVLRDIPDSICKLKRLRYFQLKFCLSVEKLPEELGRLTCLEELNIEGTSITQLPQSIYLLKGLRIVGFITLLELCGFTSEIQVLEDESFCYI